MTIRKPIIFALSLGLATSLALAQNENPSNLTGSPYSRYGMGKLGSVGNTATRSMGDLGIALRTSRYTNLLNPASLTAIDTLTMLFDVGLNVEYARYSESDVHETGWNAGFAYMSFHFPLWRNFAMSLSLSPYSVVGYEFGSQSQEAIDSQIASTDTLVYSNTYNGNGGLQKVMASIGWRPWRTKTDELNVGVNLGYIYGTVSHGALAYISSGQGQSTIVTRQFSARGFDMGIGAQYTRRLSATRSLVVGATFSPKLHLGADADIEKYSNTDTLAYSEHVSLKTAMKAGVGVTYNVDRKLMAGLDFSFENWEKVAGLDANLRRSDVFYRNITKFAAGVQYQPSIYDQNYLRTCLYRLGLSAKNSNIEVYGSQNWEYTASVGMGLPVLNRRSLVNVALEYTHLQPSKSGLLAEDYLHLTLGITFNEVMFYRSRLR